MGTILPYWEKAQLQFYRGRDKYTTKQMFIGVPRRLYQALPAVLLGVLFNALDAVSTGLLLFPSEKQSASLGSLQLQAMSMYIMR
ncbi:MAG: hypothetical protein L6R39_000408 [Caloplaca ligustica]|nr:MAG: hypothetical protein L6R39_000408 [Caloplaca ligustica]